MPAINSYDDSTSISEEHSREWQKVILEQLIEAFHSTSQSRKRLSDEFTPMLQHERVRRGKQSACLVCKGIGFRETRSKRSLKPVEGAKINKQRPS